MKIIPVDRVGPSRTGGLNGYSAKEIEKILGFSANCDDDPDKVKYSWGFTVDGKYCAIWDYKGSHKYNEFSTYGNRDVLNNLFPPRGVE
jgi:hypothetical protein